MIGHQILCSDWLNLELLRCDWAQTVNVVVYSESEAVLEIDKGRNIIYDH